MGQSIAISLGETAVKEGVDSLKKALKALLESELVKKIVQMGISAVGSMFGAGAGSTSRPCRTSTSARLPGRGRHRAVAHLRRRGRGGPGSGRAARPLGRDGRRRHLNIIDQRREGNVQTQEKTTASGERQVDVLITDVVRAGLAGGAYDRALAGATALAARGAALMAVMWPPPCRRRRSSTATTRRRRTSCCAPRWMPARRKCGGASRRTSASSRAATC